MRALLKDKNIVILGTFKPQDFDKYFLISNSIFSANEIKEGSFSVFDSKITSTEWNLYFTPNQIILGSNDPEKFDISLNKIIEKLIGFLDFDKIRAIGFNFNWHLCEFSEKIEDVSRRYFYSDKIELANKYFKSGDSAFGFSGSTNYKEARLMYSARPAKVSTFDTTKSPQISKEENVMAVNQNFNFVHKKDFDIPAILSDYESYYSFAKETISIFK